jgi:large subunit ribosomal protein L32
MSVQKQRHTKTRRDRKRARFEMKPVSMQTCTKCGKPTMPHKACPNCGFYKGKEVVNTLSKIKTQK